MFFRKKKKTAEPIPIDEIKNMSNSGMSDRDIIKDMKKRGYSYNEIERAMLQAVKDGVGESNTERPKPRSEPESFAKEPALDYMQGMYSEEEAPTDVINEASMPEFDEMKGEASPEIVIEEIVEGVVEEKWVKFKEQIEKMEETIEALRTEIKEKDIITQRAEPSKEEEQKFVDISSRVEDMEARVGGLEKAFKQFLPSLTRNIESLSAMIHEMRSRQG